MYQLGRKLAIVTGIGYTAICLAQERIVSPPPQVKSVFGVPFSAQVITERTQLLSDGNHIVRKNIGPIARDSEGRTRRQQSRSRVGRSSADTPDETVIFITDPVAGFNYMLEPSSRSARKISSLGSERTSLPADSSAAAGHVSGLDKFNVKKESLGLQMIEGVQAEGTRLTRTIPSGQVGNELPIEIVSEVWYSAELQTIVMSSNRDPRLGESSYKLLDIRREEPASSLFDIPPDYTVRELPEVSR